ncbi:hypothetical protein ACHAP4_010949 [Fusarium culmorum]
MAPEASWDNVPALVINILTFISVISGVWKYWWEVNRASAMKNLSPVGEDIDKIGFFKASVNGCRRLWPFCIRPVEAPRIPSLGSIVKLGDLGLFTASIMDGFKPEHCDVSWRPLYEGFFRECVWTMERADIGRSLVQSMFHGKHGFAEYLMKAEWDILMAKRWAEGKEDELPEPRPCCAEIPFWKLLFWFYTSSCWGESSNRHLIRPLADRLDKMDRHLLYYPWEVQKGKDREQDEPPDASPTASANTDNDASSNDTEKAEKERKYPIVVEPVLTFSIMPLDDDPIAEEKQSQDFVHSHQATLQHRATSIWNYQGSPAVRVSEEEIAALGFILGIEIKSHDKTWEPQGRGGFGTCLTSNKLDGLTVLRLIQHADRPDIINTRGGSRYSILFAKHLACGCIPFSRAKGPDYIIQTLAITSNVCDIIRRGSDLCDKCDDEKNSNFRWTDRHIKYLNNMPAHGESKNFYYMKHTPSERETDEPRGTIWKDCMEGANPYSISTWTWPNVVARLAFGGLVPMTTANVAKIVRFSVGHPPTDKDNGKKDMKALEELMTLVQQRILDQTGRLIPLFGERFQERFRQGKTKNIDYGSQALGVFDENMTDTVRHLGQYTTLLEALLTRVVLDKKAAPRLSPQDGQALAANGNANNRQKIEQNRGVQNCKAQKPNKAAKTSDTFEVGKKKCTEVYEACVEQIKRIYDHAVKEGKCGFTISIDKCLRESSKDCIWVGVKEKEEAGYVIRDLEKNGRISVEQCATVARCLIQAWTSFVRIVEWPDSNGGESREERTTQTKDASSWVPFSPTGGVKKDGKGRQEGGLAQGSGQGSQQPPESGALSSSTGGSPASPTPSLGVMETWEFKVGNGREPYHPVSLAELPDVAAWE